MILFQTLILSVLEYGFRLLTLSKTQLSRLEVNQNKAMRAILGCRRDTSAEAMRYLLNFPTMSERHRLARKSKHFFVSLQICQSFFTQQGGQQDCTQIEKRC